MRVPSAFVPAVAVLAALVVLSGCRSGSALHRRYDNFRAYYNTYYNASRQLEQGETALLNGDTPIDRTRLVELFPTGAGGGSQATFEAAISKSAELLRQRPGSKWADDALLVIGKSYFYESNFVGADQKFRETIAAAMLVNDRRLADEARFWLGRTLAAADRYDEGVLALREALALPDGDRYWQARMHLALGELNARAGRWDAATVDLRDGLAAVRDADLGARAALLLGQVEEAAGRYDAAAEAYDLALRRRPAYEIAFAAEISRGLVLGLDAGRPADGLAVLGAMARDDKNFPRRGEVALAQARVLAASGQTDAAQTRFRSVLYDQALGGQAVRGEAHYRLAEFYRDVVGDFVRASAHFDTAATAIQAPPTVAQRRSRAAIVGTTTLASTYQTVARTSIQIAAIDSLLDLAALPEAAFTARIAEIESIRLAEWAEQRRQADAQRALQDFSGAGEVRTPFGQDPGRDFGAPRGTDTPGSPGAGTEGDISGFLGFRDPRAVQSGLLSFQRLFGDRPLVPNWRRRSAITSGAAAQTLGGVTSDPQFAPGFNGLGGPPPLDLSGIPRTPEAQDSLRTSRAALRYELANTFFLSLERPDRAAALYRLILDETPNAPVAPRTRYALAELEAAGGRADAARTLYGDVAAMEDSTSALAAAARARLEGRDPVVAAPADSVSTSEDDAYVDARQIWDDGDPRAAATALVALGESDPEAPGAPRAFLAGALAYIQSLRGDSAALIAPLPPDLRPAALFDEQAVPDRAAPDAPAAPPVLLDGELAYPTAVRAPRPGVPVPVGAPAPVGSPDPDGDEDGVRLPAPPVAAPPIVTPVLDTPERPDSAVSSSDSVATVPDVFVRDYLAALARRYPASPAAGRARAVAETLPVPEAAPLPQGVTSPEVVSLPDVPSDAGFAVPDKPTRAGDPVGVPPDAPEPVVFGGFRGTDPFTLAGGGVTYRVGPFPSAFAAAAELPAFAALDLRAALATDGAGSFYILVGRFADADEATADVPLDVQPALADAILVTTDGLRLIAPPRLPDVPADAPIDAPPDVPTTPAPETLPLPDQGRIPPGDPSEP